MTHSSSSDAFDPYAWYPRQYVVRRLTKSITIDGNLEKEVWKDVPWSEPFGDIQGSDGPEESRADIPRTAFKALYDDKYLYIGAVLHPKDGLPTEAHCTKRNEPIFQKDSDFEVFIQPSFPNGADFSWNHDYKELEVNAINTPWNLLLNKPYWDGGQEHSGRVARDCSDPLYYEVYDQQTATRVVSGTLNHPTEGALWTVEVRLAYSDLLVQAATLGDYSSSSSSSAITRTAVTRPLHKYWRINFSRVEKEGLINWTWQPQYRWDPKQQRFAAFIDMHLPDAWGYLIFADDAEQSFTAGTKTAIRDPTWPAQLLATCIYYSQREHHDIHGVYADDWKALVLPSGLADPFDIHLEVANGEDSYTATVSDAKVTVKLQQDRRIIVATSFEPQIQ